MTPLVLRSSNPLAVLAAAKRAALKADWSLREWDEVSKSVRACFTEEALPEEAELMLAVLRSHFDVTVVQRQDEETNNGD